MTITDENLRAIKEALLPQRKHFVLLLPLLLTGLPAHADNGISAALKQHVEQELSSYQQRQNFQATKQKIELRIADATVTQPCDSWQFSRPNADRAPLGRVGYRIQCLQPNAWTSRAIAEVHLWAKVVIATKTLERDTQIRAGDIKLAPFDLAKLNDAALFHATDVLNKIVRRRIQAGQSILSFQLESPELVKRGDMVTLLVKIAGFSASTRGTALEDGKLNERVKVRNNSSDKVLEGTVLADGQVLVDFIGQ
ncbi:flagellar basal body P-ring formation chaperone FlgA [Shewanella sp. C32]|uniref:Flagella basal body P-ring formation protein FlgA n=1 Tax=Shewanella electrica TaxID=515560 RepID=A0ABT2FGA4_9GAMM|nr:flagellar basal body P-ring formation chaperone FlgA [Shewanella electrica]MCH1923247.1 flagellar basal body P-ring formation protein FlgA [Shewanella electrica]MCS4555344.1 flagellar basal body P-ring formation chaperone FlgA [Shewanella electrica]